MRKSLRTKFSIAVMLGASSLFAMSGAIVNSASASKANSLKTNAKLAPVKLGVIYDYSVATGDFQDYLWGAEAAASYINRSLDGINGHKIEIIGCAETDTTGASATQCAQNFASDGVLAVSGNAVTWGTVGIPLMQDSGIVSLVTPNTTAGYTNPYSHPLTVATLEGTAALAKYMSQALKINSLSIIYINTASALVTATIIENQAAKFGIKLDQLVPISGTAPTVAPSIEQAQQGNPGWIYFLTGTGQCSELMAGANQLGVTAKISASPPCATASVFQAAGAGANGSIFGEAYIPPSDTSNPSVKTFTKAVKKYQPQADIAAPTEQTFSDVMTVRSIFVGEGKKNPTSAYLEHVLTTTTKLQVFLGPIYNAKNPTPGYPNVSQQSGRIVQDENGNLVDVGGGWIDGWNTVPLKSKS